MIEDGHYRHLFIQRADRVRSSAGVRCRADPDHFELEVSYAGDPQAGGVGAALRDDADLETCPVCGSDTEPLP